MAGIWPSKEILGLNVEPLPERCPDLEEDCPELRNVKYEVKSPRDFRYNCVAFAVGDTMNWWQDGPVHGYYWPPGVPPADTLAGYVGVFTLHGYSETDDDSLEPDYEKIAIYEEPDGPTHVARQKASGAWTSKMGRGYDIDHPTLNCLEGHVMGSVVKIMKRKCQRGKRVLE